MELMTASRMSAMLACPRRHYWRYECGLTKEEPADALRFGSAWHRAMEALSQGQSPEDAFRAAVGEGQIDELAAATLWGLLLGYVDRYGADAAVKILHQEVEFETPIDRSRTFKAAGKIDGLGTLADGRLCVIEHKTTSSSLEPDSDYWLRLRADHQIIGYVAAARALGWDVGVVVYDVVRKPSIRPCKIGRGEEAHVETPEEFGARLAGDVRLRPEFYYARREVPVLEDDLVEFEALRLQVARMILDRRSEQRRMDAATPWRAWPRHVNGMLCPGCEFAAFCLQNSIPDVAHPPSGYIVTQEHVELARA